jgi:hypothetical protein
VLIPHPAEQGHVRLPHHGHAPNLDRVLVLHWRSPFGVRAEHTWQRGNPCRRRAAGLRTGSRPDVLPITFPRQTDPPRKVPSVTACPYLAPSSRVRYTRFEPVQSPAARSVQGAPLPTHVCSARTPEGESCHAHGGQCR